MAAAEQQTFAVFSPKEHIRTKDMWAGSHEPIEQDLILFDPRSRGVRAVFSRVAVAPALCHCIDEPIVNALDQAQRCARTTSINIAFDDDTGRITIANNGAGIPITRADAGDYIPTIIFSEPFSGSNLRADTNSSTIGGTNGIGVKITNYHSREFRVVTHDLARDLSFEQTWTDAADKTTGPMVRARESSDEGTTVAFILDFARFRATKDDVRIHTFTRAMWAAFYAQQFLTRTNVSWNGKPIAASARELARAIFGARARDRDLIIESDCSQNMVVFASPNVKHFATSLINGIVVPDGNHIAHIESLIKERARCIIASALHAKKAPPARMSANLSLIVLIHAPGVHWNAQAKDRALFARDQLRDALTPSSAFVARVAEHISRAILANMDAAKPVQPRRARISLDKYTPARFAGARDARVRAQCSLMLAEGDSAMSSIGIGLSRGRMFDYYGILTLRGVIINVRKASDEIEDAQTGRTYYRRRKKVVDNEFMRVLCQILGLNFACKYERDDEVAALNYGHVIGCVDQDVDGTGNIFSLILNVFHLYWPALLAHGYVQRLETPVIRAYPRAPRASSGRARVLEFYSDEEFRAWNARERSREYDVRYYKGLGTHETDEICQVIRNLPSRLITYDDDDISREMFEVYLGCNPALRREQLSRAPPARDPDVEFDLAVARVLPVSYHLMHEAHSYQLDNLSRKINDIIDGTNQVSCKIINGCMKIYARANARRKVSELAGAITASEKYHHGEASLQDAIVRRGFIAPGGMQLPFILPSGNFGTRNDGGNDSAQARYLFARYNSRINDLIFRADDYPVLTFRFDEGERVEPEHFMPIIPLAIAETIEVPAHGWNIRVWAREVTDIIANLRALIRANGDPNVHLARMRPCCYPTDAIAGDCSDPNSPYLWHGRIVERANDRGQMETWSIGAYSWENDTTIRVTELPLGVWSKQYACEMQKTSENESSIIDDCWFAPDSDRVQIRITLRKQCAQYSALLAQRDCASQRAALDDPIICALRLRAKMTDSLNFLVRDDADARSRVITFRSYEEILRYWFPIRRDFYARRIARARELLAMRVLHIENVLKYIDLARAEALVIAKLTDEEATLALTAAGIARLNVAILNSPELKYTARVEEAVLKNDPSFDYILNLRERDVTVTGRATYARKLEELRASSRALELDAAIDRAAPFIGARIWLRELDELEGAIVEGRRTRWKYKEYDSYTFGDEAPPATSRGRKRA